MLSFIAFAGATLFALPLTHAVVVPAPLPDDHASIVQPRSDWYHSEDHPAHALFKRQSDPTDGVTYATVGSPAWVQAYPAGLPNTSKMPQPWIDALNAAVSAGTIPNLPPSTLGAGGMTVYPNGLNASGPQVCSGTYQCQIPGDVWEAPAGYLGCGFDDGPLPPSDQLYQFLQQNNQHATHFFIGINIVQYPKEFLMAFGNGDDIAVHTWTHPYMTTLNNLDLVAQFGWTMQIIHNSTGGRLPRFWRPPYGDTDVRVQAIAKEIFGLTAILWNQDTNDWALPGGTTMQKINSSMTQWLTGPKSPGLIILEHELSNQSVQAFMNAYPVMKSNGWNITSAAQLAGAVPYQNAQGSDSPVTPANGVIVGSINTSEAPSVTTTTTTTTSGLTATSAVSKITTGGALRHDMGPSFWFVSAVTGAVVTILRMFA